jgi:type IV pilus assembly protein PilM
MAMDLQALALVRAVAGIGIDLTEGARAVVTIGAGLTQLTIVKAASVRFLRTVPIGGETFTRTLAEALSSDFQKAEHQKRRIGVLPDGDPLEESDEGRRALTLEADTLIEEVRGSIEYYRSESGGDHVTGILISGNGARLPHLANRLGVSLGMPVEPVRVDQGGTVTIGKLGMSEAELAQIQPVLPIAVGLALWGET